MVSEGEPGMGEGGKEELPVDKEGREGEEGKEGKQGKEGKVGQDVTEGKEAEEVKNGKEEKEGKESKQGKGAGSVGEYSWVQCEKEGCGKWRRIPAHLADDLEGISWDCSMNPAAAYSRCEVPQEKTDEEINLELGLDKDGNLIDSGSEAEEDSDDEQSGGQDTESEDGAAVPMDSSEDEGARGAGGRASRGGEGAAANGAGKAKRKAKHSEEDGGNGVGVKGEGGRGGYVTRKEEQRASRGRNGPLVQQVFQLVKENIYRRKEKVLEPDEVPVCQCRRPPPGRHGCGEDCLNRTLLYECVTKTCPCGDLCSNQQFQSKAWAKLRFGRAGARGFGLFTEQDLRSGQFVMEYVGEVLSVKQFEARKEEYRKTGLLHHYFMALNQKEYIDACRKGNLGRFINHSCDPNCITQKWSVNGEIRIGLFACKDLKAGTELTTDYQLERFGDSALACRCEAANCRGLMGAAANSDGGAVTTHALDFSEEPEPVVIPEGAEIPPEYRHLFLEIAADERGKARGRGAGQAAADAGKGARGAGGGGKARSRDDSSDGEEGEEEDDEDEEMDGAVAEGAARSPSNKLGKAKGGTPGKKGQGLRHRERLGVVVKGGLRIRKRVAHAGGGASIEKQLDRFVDRTGAITDKNQVVEIVRLFKFCMPETGPDAERAALSSCRDLSILLEAFLRSRSAGVFKVLAKIGLPTFLQVLAAMRNHPQQPAILPMLRKTLKVLSLTPITREELDKTVISGGESLHAVLLSLRLSHREVEIQKTVTQILSKVDGGSEPPPPSSLPHHPGGTRHASNNAPLAHGRSQLLSPPSSHPPSSQQQQLAMQQRLELARQHQARQQHLLQLMQQAQPPGASSHSHGASHGHDPLSAHPMASVAYPMDDPSHLIPLPPPPPPPPPVPEGQAQLWSSIAANAMAAGGKGVNVSLPGSADPSSSSAAHGHGMEPLRQGLMGLPLLKTSAGGGGGGGAGYSSGRTGAGAMDMSGGGGGWNGRDAGDARGGDASTYHHRGDAQHYGSSQQQHGSGSRYSDSQRYGDGHRYSDVPRYSDSSRHGDSSHYGDSRHGGSSRQGSGGGRGDYRNGVSASAHGGSSHASGRSSSPHRDHHGSENGRHHQGGGDRNRRPGSDYRQGRSDRDPDHRDYHRPQATVPSAAKRIEGDAGAGAVLAGASGAAVGAGPVPGFGAGPGSAVGAVANVGAGGGTRAPTGSAPRLALPPELTKMIAVMVKNRLAKYEHKQAITSLESSRLQDKCVKNILQMEAGAMQKSGSYRLKKERLEEKIKEYVRKVVHSHVKSRHKQ
eukprot:jgi/Mesvir1/28205/Mv04757-RA.1